MSTVNDLPASAKLLYKPYATILGDEQGYGAEMGWVCDYADQDAFLTAVIGTHENVGNGVTRLVPLRHPRYSNMLATNFKAEGFGHDSTVAHNIFGYQYAKSRIIVTFHIPPFPIIGGEAFRTIQLRKGNQGVSIPESGYKFPSTGKRISGVDAAFTVPMTTYQITLFNCPTQNDDLITTLQANPVNSVPVLNKAAGTMKLDGVDTEIVQLTNGQITYTKSIAMTWRAIDWNKLVNEEGDWEKPEKISDSSFIYGTSDLNQLFNV